MMKQQIAGILPQLLLGGWVNYFFPGFILMKLPFGLPARFKVMLQRGMPLDNLEVSYVTSLSWYFISLIGLRGINTLIMGQAALASDPMMQQMRMQESAGMAAKQDPAKLSKQERNELEITTVCSKHPSLARSNVCPLCELYSSAELLFLALTARPCAQHDPLVVHSALFSVQGHQAPVA